MNPASSFTTLGSPKSRNNKSDSSTPNSHEEKYESTASGGHGYDGSGLMEQAIVQPSGHGAKGGTSFNEEINDTTGEYSDEVDGLMKRLNAIMPGNHSTQMSQYVPSRPSLNGERHESVGEPGYDVDDLSLIHI